MTAAWRPQLVHLPLHASWLVLDLDAELVTADRRLVTRPVWRDSDACGGAQVSRRTAQRRLSVVIDVATVPERHHDDHEHVISHGVENAVVPDT